MHFQSAAEELSARREKGKLFINLNDLESIRFELAKFFR